MKHRSMVSFAVVLAVASAVAVLPAVAVAPTGLARVWVSAAKGSDVAGCGPATSPCRSFQFAIGNVAANGEIDVMDPGGYGPVVIDKAVAIVNDGVGTVAVQGPSGGAAIQINAGVSDHVLLQGLTVEGSGVGLNGIEWDGGFLLIVRNCTVRGFSNAAIVAQPANAGPNRYIQEQTSTFDSGWGVILYPPNGTEVDGKIAHSTSDNNTSGGFVASSNQGGIAGLFISDSEAHFSTVPNQNVFDILAYGSSATVGLKNDNFERATNFLGTLISYGGNIGRMDNLTRTVAPQ